MCAFKFFLRQLYEEYDEKIHEKEDQVKKITNIFNKNRKEFTELKTTYDQRKTEFKSEKKRQQRLIAELELKISNIKREHKQIIDESERLGVQMNESQKSAKEISEKHEELEEKLEKVNAEYKKLLTERDAVKRETKNLENLVNELKDAITAAKMKQPKQGKKKIKNNENATKNGLLEPVLNQATEHEDLSELKKSIVDPEKKCCLLL